MYTPLIKKYLHTKKRKKERKQALLNRQNRKVCKKVIENKDKNRGSRSRFGRRVSLDHCDGARSIRHHVIAYAAQQHPDNTHQPIINFNSKNSDLVFVFICIVGFQI